MPKSQELQTLSRTTQVLFQYIDDRRWKEAEALVKQTREHIQTHNANREEEQIRGYVDALQGMLIGLREKHSSSELFIHNVQNRSKRRLKEFKKTFYTQSCGRLYPDYDQGFFRAWYEYVKFLETQKSDHTKSPET